MFSPGAASPITKVFTGCNCSKLIVIFCMFILNVCVINIFLNPLKLRIFENNTCVLIYIVILSKHCTNMCHDYNIIAQ